MKRELSINELNNVEGGFGIAAVIGLTFASAIIAFFVHVVIPMTGVKVSGSFIFRWF